MCGSATIGTSAVQCAAGPPYCRGAPAKVGLFALGSGPGPFRALAVAVRGSGTDIDTDIDTDTD